jgi:hypothetical protein
VEGEGATQAPTPPPPTTMPPKGVTAAQREEAAKRISLMLEANHPSNAPTKCVFVSLPPKIQATMAAPKEQTIVALALRQKITSLVSAASVGATVPTKSGVALHLTSDEAKKKLLDIGSITFKGEQCHVTDGCKPPKTSWMMTLVHPTTPRGDLIPVEAAAMWVGLHGQLIWSRADTFRVEGKATSMPNGNLTFGFTGSPAQLPESMDVEGLIEIERWYVAGGAVKHLCRFCKGTKGSCTCKKKEEANAVEEAKQEETNIKMQKQAKKKLEMKKQQQDRQHEAKQQKKAKQLQDEQNKKSGGCSSACEGCESCSMRNNDSTDSDSEGMEMEESQEQKQLEAEMEQCQIQKAGDEHPEKEEFTTNKKGSKKHKGNAEQPNTHCSVVVDVDQSLEPKSNSVEGGQAQANSGKRSGSDVDVEGGDMTMGGEGGSTHVTNMSDHTNTATPTIPHAPTFMSNTFNVLAHEVNLSGSDSTHESGESTDHQPAHTSDQPNPEATHGPTSA